MSRGERGAWAGRMARSRVLAVLASLALSACCSPRTVFLRPVSPPAVQYGLLRDEAVGERVYKLPPAPPVPPTARTEAVTAWLQALRADLVRMQGRLRAFEEQVRPPGDATP